MPDIRTSHERTQTSSRGWELLKTRDFGLLFAGQTISQIGDSLNKMALLWFVYELTGSALKMTMIGLLQTLPPLLLGPLIGVYLDRFRKKPVMRARVFFLSLSSRLEHTGPFSSVCRSRKITRSSRSTSPIRI